MSSSHQPPPRPARGRYTWFLGVVAFLLLVLVTVNSITNEGIRSGGPEENSKLIDFVVPLAEAPPREDEDANLDPERVCEVRGPGILTLCDLRRKGPVVLTVFPADGEKCRDVMMQFQRLAPDFPNVSFVAVGSGDERKALAGDWSYPVGWDKDRAVASTYGLVGCPQITFAHKGGKVLETTHREMSDAQIAGLVRRL
jgi:hypothetical protein